MYSPPNLVFFTPFKFPEGNTRRKYVIFLMNETDDGILGGFTTRHDSIPSFVEKIHGCIDRQEINFNCYYFKKGESVTENEWGFPLDTYCYGSLIRFFDINNLKVTYKKEGVDYQIIGKLKKDVFKNLISCIRDSKTVKRKFRRLLGAKI